MEAATGPAGLTGTLVGFGQCLSDRALGYVPDSRSLCCYIISLGLPRTVTGWGVYHDSRSGTMTSCFSFPSYDGSHTTVDDEEV